MKKRKRKPEAKIIIRSRSGTGFTLGVPTRWAHISLKDSVASFLYRDPATHTNVVEVTSSGRGFKLRSERSAATFGSCFRFATPAS